MAVNGKGRVCILNTADAFKFEETHILPSCRDHRHCGKKEADELTNTRLYWDGKKTRYQARYLGKGKRAIMLHDAREFRPARSGGVRVWQLVPVGR